MLAIRTAVGEASSSIPRASPLLVRLFDNVGVLGGAVLDSPVELSNATENASCCGADLRSGNAAESSTCFLRQIRSFRSSAENAFDRHIKGTCPDLAHCRSMHSCGSSETPNTRALNLKQIFEGLASESAQESKVDSKSESQRPAEVPQEEETASTSTYEELKEQKVAEETASTSTYEEPKEQKVAGETTNSRPDGSPRNFAHEQIAQVSIVAKAFEPEMVEHFRDSVLAVWEQEGEESAEALTSGEVQPQKSANQPWVRPQKGAVSLPVHKRRFTVLRSPHIDKKSREQFEINVHKRLIKIPVTMRELPLLVDWLKENAFIGVQLTVTVNYQTPLYAPQ